MTGAVAIIPARGGSKRIPGKNIRPFGGRPMIAWSIDAAQESGAFDAVIVSTDDEEIAKVARSCGAEVPFFRPKEISDDFAPLMPVLRWHLQEWATNPRPEWAFCVYATAPFLRARRLREAADLLRETDADFVLAVTEFEYPVQRSLRIDHEKGLAFAEPAFALTRSQDLEPRFRDAGQFFGGRVAAIARHDAVLFGSCRPVPVPREEAIDIDTPEDWRTAERLFAIREGASH